MESFTLEFRGLHGLAWAGAGQGYRVTPDEADEHQQVCGEEGPQC